MEPAQAPLDTRRKLKINSVYCFHVMDKTEWNIYVNLQGTAALVLPIDDNNSHVKIGDIIRLTIEYP